MRKTFAEMHALVEATSDEELPSKLKSTTVKEAFEEIKLHLERFEKFLNQYDWTSEEYFKEYAEYILRTSPLMIQNEKRV